MPIQILVVLMLAFGCTSLPSKIAERAALTSESCAPAAAKTFEALCLLQYPNVRECRGRVVPNSEGHAWVEYGEGDNVTIVDPYATLDGKHVHRRVDLPSDYFVPQFIIKIERMTDRKGTMVDRDEDKAEAGYTLDHDTNLDNRKIFIVTTLPQKGT